MNLDDRPDSFEDRLLTELKQEVERRNEAAPAAPQWRRGRYLALAAAVLLAAGVPALGWWNSTPAFAVEPTGDGEIKVSVKRLAEPEALEQALAAQGIKADVSYTPAGKACAAGRYQEALPNAALALGAEVDQAGTWSLTLAPRLLRAGETLVLESSWTENTWSLTTGIAAGPVGSCTLVDAPAAPETPEPSNGAAATSNGEPLCKATDLPAGIPTDDFVPDPRCKDA